MRLVRLVPLALLMVACSGGPGAAPSVVVPSGAVRIDVKLSDALKIDPATIDVPSGQPVVFVVTNAGGVQHEFFVGDEGAQSAHEAEMAASNGVAHDSASGLAVPPGQTRELTLTFQSPGTIFGGCHIQGHYAAGMKTTITIH